MHIIKAEKQTKTGLVIQETITLYGYTEKQADRYIERNIANNGATIISITRK